MAPKPKITQEQLDKIQLDPEFEYLRERITRIDCNGYAVVSMRGFDLSHKKAYWLHHFIIGKPIDNHNFVVDHVNQDKFDNRKKNLRIVNKRLNSLNSTRNSKNKLNITRKYRGTYLCPKTGKYELRCDVARDLRLVFKNDLEAVVAAAYDYLNINVLKLDHYIRQVPELVLDSEAMIILNESRDCRIRSQFGHVRIVYKQVSTGRMLYEVKFTVNNKLRIVYEKSFEKALTLANSLGYDKLTIKQNGIAETIEKVNW